MARRYHSKKIRDIGKYRRLGHVLIGESNLAIVPAIGGYGVEDIYLGEFSPHLNRDDSSLSPPPYWLVASGATCSTSSSGIQIYSTGATPPRALESKQHDSPRG